MAVNWYLMNTNHDKISGFENDDFNKFASDAFNEALKPLGTQTLKKFNPEMAELSIQSFEKANVMHKVVMFLNLSNDPIVERIITPPVINGYCAEAGKPARARSRR